MPIELKLKHKVSDNEIVFYTEQMLKIFATIFAIIYVATIGAILYMSYSLNAEFKMETVWFCTIILLIFPILFWVGNKQIIFNKRDETVYKSHGLGRKEVARFSEIASIQYVDGNNCCKIFLKSDPYGKGIAITSPIIGKVREKFDTETLPVLEQMIFANRIETQSTTIVNIENLKYYTRSNTVFKIKKDFNTIWFSFVVLLGVAIFIWLYISNLSEYLFLPFFPILAGVYGGSRRSFFDVAN
jgi:DNA-binding XRE family transcriptional regulator